MFRSFNLILLAIFITCMTSGCLIQGALVTLDEVAATEGTRVGTLEPTATQYHKAMAWSSPDGAIKFVSSRIVSSFYRKYPGMHTSERIVSIDISNVDFRDDAYDAYVDITIKYFPTSSLAVKEKHQTELWRYHRMGGGWLLENPEVDKTDSEGLDQTAQTS